MEYAAPVNPRHENILRLEDMWWVDDAWDTETLDWLVEATRERGDRFDLALLFQAFADEGIYMNLPGILPSGEWLAEYLLAIRDEEGFLRPFYITKHGKRAFQKFEDWNEHPHLSKPVRLSVYLTEFGMGGSEITDMVNVLLSTSTLTDDDVRFLIDYGADLSNGALPAVLHNARLVSTPNYDVALDAFFKVRSAERRNPRIDFERISLVVGNPAAPSYALHRIVSELTPELGLAEAWSLEPEGGLPQGTFDLRLRQYREEVRLAPSSYLVEQVPHYAELANRIQSHPNWDGEDFSFSIASPTPWGGTLPTFAPLEETGNSVDQLDSGERNFLEDRAWGYVDFYRIPPFKHLRQGAEALVAPGANAAGYDFAIYLPALGALLKEYRNALDIQEGEIPHEWVTLLFS